jgi:hypothetical protein
MDHQNSQYKDYLVLCSSLLRQDPVRTSPRMLKRDLLELTNRFSHEGVSFLTKTLPKLGKALDEGLNTSRFSRPQQFRHCKGSSSIPAFMQEYFKRVFTEDGVLLENPCVDAIKHLRQVCFSMYKLNIGYSPSEEQRVISDFIQTECDLERGSLCEAQSLLETASHICENVLSDFDPKNILPRHGPGATATGEKLEEKWEFSRLYKQIHQVFPYYDYFIVGRGRELIDRLDWYKSLDRRESGEAKVVLVPKDSRGPRLISCEPLEYQFVQQGIGRKLVSHLEASRFTGGQVNFTDQTINGQLALKSSLDRKFSTLDLKEASDRVSVALVEATFKRVPSVLRALLATRTTATKLPDGSTINLNKFAPMGSALCFPVEALVFWLIVVAAIIRETRKPLHEAGRLVFVYGDDIIVPTEYFDLTRAALESCLLKVNEAKSCSKGYFRESCGVDAFKGIDITPIKIRNPWTNKRPDASTLASYVAYSNSLLEKGYTEASATIREMIKKSWGILPLAPKNSSYIGYTSSHEEAVEYNYRHFRERWNSRYHRVEYRVPTILSSKRKTTLDGWQRLLRNQLVPLVDVDPSEVVRPYSTKIKWAWRSISF